MGKISKPLLFWYYNSARDLPWRVVKDLHPNPYFVWVSEVMLQQTGVKTVIPYFQRFIQAFPTVDVLAKANQDQVLSLWQGLGYYSRARNLHAGAKQIVAMGEFPQTAIELLKIKGIGPYTSAAIGSISFGETIPVVDGNVKRVFSRLFCLEEKGQALHDRAFELSLAEIESSPGDYNSALMDLGATVCSPRNPQCEICPLKLNCCAFKAGCVLDYPKKIEKKPMPTKYGIVAWVEKDGELLIRKREQGILKGLYELPWDEVEKTDYDKIDSDFVKHTFTHFHLYLKIVRTKKIQEGQFILFESLKDYPFSTLMKKILK
ncbi:MAG: A/G-specific adenine glycosylase, partial [Alphaproteobacteria bacterium]|nr:A/G-specific adenine glycosylase [Alphaproteobacteria bacterium]